MTYVRLCKICGDAHEDTVGDAICYDCRIQEQAKEISRLRGELENVKGFNELIDRLCKDAPILPNPNYSQDVAFIASSISSWRKEAIAERTRANKLEIELNDARSLLNNLGIRHDAEKKRADLNYKALELACEDTNTWRNTMNICKLDADYFIKKVQEEK